MCLFSLTVRIIGLYFCKLFRKTFCIILWLLSQEFSSSFFYIDVFIFSRKFLRGNSLCYLSISLYISYICSWNCLITSFRYLTHEFPVYFSQIVLQSFQFCLSVSTCIKVKFYDVIITADLIRHYFQLIFCIYCTVYIVYIVYIAYIVPTHSF